VQVAVAADHRPTQAVGVVVQVAERGGFPSNSRRDPQGPGLLSRSLSRSWPHSCIAMVTDVYKTHTLAD
jgi:hypothetical protein